MNSYLSNRAFTPPADGWFHVVPRGEFSHPSGVVQVLDDHAVKAIVQDFNNRRSTSRSFPGLLVDFDHFSTDSSLPSEAAGWIVNLEDRTDGAWAKIDLSDAGESALRGGRYRLVSPVFDAKSADKLGNNRVRPRRLLSVGFTNSPNMEGIVPLSNSLRRREMRQALIEPAVSEQLRIAIGAESIEQVNQCAAQGIMRLLTNRLQATTGASFEESWQRARIVAPALANSATSGRPIRWEELSEPVRLLVEPLEKAFKQRLGEMVARSEAASIPILQPGVATGLIQKRVRALMDKGWALDAAINQVKGADAPVYATAVAESQGQHITFH